MSCPPCDTRDHASIRSAQSLGETRRQRQQTVELANFLEWVGLPVTDTDAVQPILSSPTFHRTEKGEFAHEDGCE